jgi:hypothetical protein
MKIKIFSNIIMPQHTGKKMNGNGKSKPKPKALTEKQKKNLPPQLQKAIMAKRGKM